MPDRHDDRDMTMDSVKLCKRFKIKNICNNLMQSVKKS